MTRLHGGEIAVGDCQRDWVVAVPEYSFAKCAHFRLLVKWLELPVTTPELPVASGSFAGDPFTPTSAQNLIFTLHHSAWISLRKNVTKLHVVRQRSK